MSVGHLVKVTAAGGGGADGVNIISAGTQEAGTNATVVFSNSNGVTFGMSNNSIVTASHNGLTSQSNQALSAANGSFAFQTASFSNANGISFSTSAGSAIVASHNGLTSQSNQAVSAANGSYAFQTLSFSNANGVSFGTSAGSALTASYTVPTVTNSSWTVSDSATSGSVARLAFTNLNGVTLSLSTGAGGSHTIVGSHNALTSQSNQAASAANGSFTFQTLNFTDASGFAFSTSAGSAVYVRFTGTNAGSVYASSQTTGQSSSSSVNLGALTMRGMGIVSVGLSAGEVIISASGAGGADGVNILAAGTQTANTTGSVLFNNSNGITFGMSNSSVITASHNGLTSRSNQAVSATNGSFTFQTLSLADSNGISFSTGTQGVFASHNGLTSQGNQAASAANGSFAFQTISFSNLNGVSFGTSAGSAITASHNGITSQSNQQISAYAVSNTTQSSSGTVQAANLSFAGAGVASVGVSNGSVVISVPSGGGAGDGVNILAAGTQTANTTGTVVFSNSNGVTFGMNNSSVITASVNAGGGGGATLSYHNPYHGQQLLAGQMGQGSLFMAPMPVSCEVRHDRFAHPILFSGATNSTGQFTCSFRVGIYTKNASTLSLASSSSFSTAWTHSGTQNSSLHNGGRIFTLGWTNTLTGGDYWLAVVSSTSSSSQNASLSNYVLSQVNSSHSGIFGAATTASAQRTLGAGVYSAATNAMPSSIAFSQIYGLSSAFNRPPAYYFISGTA